MIRPYLTMLRPTQWLKNLMLFFPPFLAGYLPGGPAFTEGVWLFAAFCLVSSAGYLFNDLLDCEQDRLHPRKRLRPLPSGTVAPRAVTVICALLVLAGLGLARLVLPQMFLFCGGYALLLCGYTLYLKQLPVVDIFCIAAGFLIRLQAGGTLFGVTVSPWLFLTVFLLAVFLSTGKRLGEVRLLGEGAGNHRGSLAHYPEGFLAGTMHLTGAAVLVTYAMYTLQKPRLVYSVPLCLFGLLRYLLRVSSGKGGDPTESLLHDRVLLVVGIAWAAMVVWSIHR